MSLIELKNVYQDFKDGNETIQALKKTNLSIKAGEFVAIIGPSGSGKSTLLTIMGGLQRPTGGSVILNGKNFNRANAKQRSKLRFDEIGFILQASNLVPYLTVIKQLELIDRVNGKPFDYEKASNLLDSLGILSLKSKYPSGLSGGERQRASIARALYSNPSLILADEPTASLDSVKAFEVVEILARETKENNKATVMVTHDERLLSFCDKIYAINDGVLADKTKIYKK